jgi:hypothetical protein
MLGHYPCASQKLPFDKKNSLFICLILSSSIGASPSPPLWVWHFSIKKVLISQSNFLLFALCVKFEHKFQSCKFLIFQSNLLFFYFVHEGKKFLSLWEVVSPLNCYCVLKHCYYLQNVQKEKILQNLDVKY